LRRVRADREAFFVIAVIDESEPDEANQYIEGVVAQDPRDRSRVNEKIEQEAEWREWIGGCRVKQPFFSSGGFANLFQRLKRPLAGASAAHGGWVF
jgi:hypothetical protein